MENDKEHKEVVLEIKNLKLGLQKSSLLSSRLLLDNISLKVHKKEVVAIIGASGSGKSLTALSTVKLLPDGIKQLSGQVIFDGVDFTNLKEKEMEKIRGKNIGFVFQNPLLAFNPLKKVFKQLIEPLIIHCGGISKQEIEERVKEVLELVDLQDCYQRLNNYPHQFSGGQLQRLMIAMAIINKPKFLIADEPTTALDKISGAKVIKLLSELAIKLELSVLVISHDLKAVKDLANRVYVLDSGVVVEKGQLQSVFSNPKHNITKLLTGKIEYLKELKEDENLQNILEVKNINTRYIVKNNLIFKNKYRDFLKDINFTVKEQDSVGLIGRSGTGKSSIINAILQLYSYEGAIYLSGKDIAQPQNKAFLRKNLQLVFQNPSSSLNPRALVKDLVYEGLNIHKKDLSKQEKSRIILSLFDEMELGRNLLLRYSTELSGGQKQRVAIIRALAMKPKILVLDEPTSALDKISEMKVMQVLRKMQKEEKMAFVFISHNMDMVKSFCNKLLVIENGQIVEKGLLKDIIADPKHDVSKMLLF